MNFHNLALSAVSIFVLIAGSMTASAAGDPVAGSRTMRADAIALDLVRTGGMLEAGWKLEATRLLKRSGVTDPSGPMRESLAVALLRELGLEVTTSTPDREVSIERAAAFIRQAEGLLQPAGGAPVSSASRGPGGSPASIDDCFFLRNHGACVVCCLEGGFPGSTCAKLCFVINKPSPSEPLP